MATTDGAVVGREMLVRACGCELEFLHYERDPWRAERRVKFLARRCTPCGMKHSAAQGNKIGTAGRVKKGTEVKLIPVGTLLMLRREPDGTWSGRAQFADGREPIETRGGGAMTVLSKLARKMIVASGAKVVGQVKD